MATDGAASERRFVGRELVSLASCGAVLAPLGIVLHEMGHFIVGLSLGFPVRLNVGSVSGGPAIGAATDQAVAMQVSHLVLLRTAGIGPSGIGCVLTAKRRQPLGPAALNFAYA